MDEERVTVPVRLVHLIEIKKDKRKVRRPRRAGDAPEIRATSTWIRAIVARDEGPEGGLPARPLARSRNGGRSRMFAYIDPTVSTRLADQGKLFRIDRRGQRLDLDAPVSAGSRALDLLGPIPLPLHVGGADLDADWFAVVRHTELEPVDELARSLHQRGAVRRFASIVSHMSVDSVLVFGDLSELPDPLVRVHSNCLTGDVFGSQRCDCGPQLADAMRRVADAGGIIVYMAGHEGRGIGLWAKAATYVLQDGGENTYQANRSLGLPDDSRDFLRCGGHPAPLSRRRPSLPPPHEQPEEGGRYPRPRARPRHGGEARDGRRRAQPAVPRGETRLGPRDRERRSRFGRAREFGCGRRRWRGCGFRCGCGGRARDLAGRSEPARGRLRHELS